MCSYEPLGNRIQEFQVKAIKLATENIELRNNNNLWYWHNTVYRFESGV